MLELMRLSRHVPLVTAERRMNLADLAIARQGQAVKISWTCLFMKAFAIIAARRPDLRTAYMSFPYAHLYESPLNVATIIIEREHQGECFPYYCRFRDPERQSLLELNRALEHFKTVPLDQDKHFCRMDRIGRMPGLIRRWAWNMGYHWKGRKRAHYFGTFGLSSPAASGAGLTTIVSPLTCTLHYGLFDEASRLDMRITFDHRAIDGAPVARALTEMEQVLMSDIRGEVEQLSPAKQAA